MAGLMILNHPAVIEAHKKAGYDVIVPPVAAVPQGVDEKGYAHSVPLGVTKFDDGSYVIDLGDDVIIRFRSGVSATEKGNRTWAFADLQKRQRKEKAKAPELPPEPKADKPAGRTLQEPQVK